MRTPIIFISLLLTLLAAVPARAQPFTYQGHLSDATGPVAGSVDLRFRLYRSATGTQQVGTQVLAPATQVDEGTFTTTLDFGSVLSSDEERWIEIEVRQSSDLYTTLSPRQRITAAPIAHKLTGLQFTPTGPVAADQLQDSRGILNRNVQFSPAWQSFTPSVSGTLDRIELIISTTQSSPLTVTLHAGVGLDGPVLAAATVTPSPTGTRSAEFGNVTLFAGNPYTMVFSCPATFLLATTSAPIPGAIGYWEPDPNPAIQWFFRTYMRPAATVNAIAQQSASAVVANLAFAAQSAPWSGLTGQAEVSTPAIGTAWQLFLINRSTSTWRGGLRLADTGFLEITNNANATTPNFARLNGVGAWTAVSDRRLKHDIHAAEGNLAAALKLQPVTFRWNLDDREDLGLIAQDVRQVLPHLVTGDESKENLTVNYSQLSVVAIGAIQEQQQKIESLEQRLLDQTRRNDDLQSRLETLEQLLGANK